MAVRDRLRSARTTLLVRLQAAALSLEGLHARLAELAALAQAPGGLDDPGRRAGELAADLEGLRRGLAEAEALSRRTLSPAQGLPDVAPGPA